MDHTAPTRQLPAPSRRGPARALSLPGGAATADTPASCTLPPRVSRQMARPMGAPGDAAEMPRRTLPPAQGRQPAAAQGLSAGTADGPAQRILPPRVARAHAAPVQGAAPSPERTPGPQTPMTAPRDRAHAISPKALFKLVRSVARGISGAAGHAYTAEDPEGARLRYGLLAARLDTGDLGEVLALAQARDGAALSAVLGPQTADFVTTARAPTPTARTAPVGGEPPWGPGWRARLTKAGGLEPMQAAQNEWAIEAALRPLADRLVVDAGEAPGPVLAAALDALTELGRETTLARIDAALAAGTPAFDIPESLAQGLPATARRRAAELRRDPDVCAWRATTAQEVPA